MKHADQGRFSRGIILLLCIGIFGYPSCLPRKEAESVNNASRDNALINSSISAETAKFIARGYLCFDYDLRGLDTEVADSDKSWKVSFFNRESNEKKYGPIIFIDKVTGEQTDVIHSK